MWNFLPERNSRRLRWKEPRCKVRLLDEVRGEVSRRSGKPKEFRSKRSNGRSDPMKKILGNCRTFLITVYSHLNVFKNVLILAFQIFEFKALMCEQTGYDVHIIILKWRNNIFFLNMTTFLNQHLTQTD